MATLRKGLLWQQDILCYGNTEKGISFVMATLRKGLLWQQDILCYGNTEKGFIMATRYPLLWQH